MFKLSGSYALLMGALAVALLSGCASEFARPDNQLNATESAITAAESANARDAAPVLLNSAQNKLLDARDAINKEQFKKATWLLEDAEAEANLAKAKAQTDDTRQAVAELESSIDSLRDRVNDSTQ